MPLLDFEHEFPQIVPRLLDICAHDRLGHAYLLLGDDSEYLQGFVLAWLQVCLCPQRRQSGDACGCCQVCTQVARLQYPELFVRRPHSRLRQILIDDIRSLERELSLTGSGRSRKVALILDADRMPEQAQNAFLKTLEEPPASTLLVLVSTQPRALLATIRSRCQQVSIRRNRQDYSAVQQLGLFSLLARLQPAAGAAEALAVAARLQALFVALRQRAEQTVTQPSSTATAADAQLQQMAKEDTALAKRLAEAETAAIESEYRRLRQQVLDALHCWFLQESLLAAGVAPAQLPQPELLSYRNAAVAAVIAARQQATAAGRFANLLHTNVNERLALEALCLELTRK